LWLPTKKHQKGATATSYEDVPQVEQIGVGIRVNEYLLQHDDNT
jgi:hypothetical protein